MTRGNLKAVQTVDARSKQWIARWAEAAALRPRSLHAGGDDTLFSRMRVVHTLKDHTSGLQMTAW